jgi:hypothetical protein
MKKLILGLTLAISVGAQAAKSPLSESCKDKVVTAVNKHHEKNLNSEGGVFAIRDLYNGEFASVLLIGHSDETDPSDYLVTVEKKRCVVKSIVYTNEASDTEEYSQDEYLER